MPKLRAIEFLGRRVRFMERHQIGWIGPDGRQIGKLIDIGPEDEGTVISVRRGLTIRPDKGGEINLPQDEVVLLPRA